MEELILKEKEVRDSIVKIINEANLPAFIIKPMLKDFFEQVSALEQKQYEEAKENKEKIEKKERNKECQVVQKT